MLMPLAGFVLASASLQAAPSLNGAYYASHPIWMAQSDKTENQDDSLELHEKSPTELEFKLFQVFSNLHTCDLDGVAKKSGDSYLYTGAEDGQTCTVTLSVSKDAISVSAEGSLCSQYCGMNGSIGQTFALKSRAKGSGEASADSVRKLIRSGEFDAARFKLESLAGKTLSGADRDAVRLELLKAAHTKMLALWKQKKKKQAADIAQMIDLLVPEDFYKTSQERRDPWAEPLNDAAFIASESSKRGETTFALLKLKDVVRFWPERWVAWLNLGDAAWKQAQGWGMRGWEATEAENAYLVYARHMDPAKWPKTLRDRCKLCSKLAEIDRLRKSPTEVPEPLRGKWKAESAGCDQRSAGSAGSIGLNEQLQNKELKPGISSSNGMSIEHELSSPPSLMEARKREMLLEKNKRASCRVDTRYELVVLDAKDTKDAKSGLVYIRQVDQKREHGEENPACRVYPEGVTEWLATLARDGAKLRWTIDQPWARHYCQSGTLTYVFARP